MLLLHTQRKFQSIDWEWHTSWALPDFSCLFFWNKQVSEKLCQGRFMSSISIKRWSRLEQQIDSSILSYITGKLLDVDTIAPISSSMIPVIWASRYIPQYDKWHIAGWAQIQFKAPWHSVPVYWMSVITVMAHGSMLFFFLSQGTVWMELTLSHISTE